MSYKEFRESKSRLYFSGNNFLIEKTKSGKFIYKRFNPDVRALTHLTSYKSKKFEILDGLTLHKYDDGTVVTKGEYVNGLKEGFWIEAVYSSGSYKNGLKEGVWNSYRQDSSLSIVVNYHKGLKQGVYMQYDSLGQLSFQSEYQNDSIVSTSRDTTTKLIEILPRFSGCTELNIDESKMDSCSQKKFLQFVYSNLKYPKKSRRLEIEGKALVNFTVNIDGSIKDIHVLNGVSHDIQEEVLRILNLMPKWQPGRQNGEAVKVLFTLPVRFKLE